MKKVRITTKKGSNGKRFQIFNSPESLYVWMNDPDLQAEEKLDSSLGMTVHLKEGETMEVEWLGCEFIFEESFNVRADFIRLGKMIKVKPTLSKDLVGIHRGWVIDDIIPFNSMSDDKIKVVRLSKKSKHKFDLDELFSSRKDSDSAIEEPKVLN